MRTLLFLTLFLASFSALAAEEGHPDPSNCKWNRHQEGSPVDLQLSIKLHEKSGTAMLTFVPVGPAPLPSSTGTQGVVLVKDQVDEGAEWQSWYRAGNWAFMVNHESGYAEVFEYTKTPDPAPGAVNSYNIYAFECEVPPPPQGN